MGRIEFSVFQKSKLAVSYKTNYYAKIQEINAHSKNGVLHTLESHVNSENNNPSLQKPAFQTAAQMMASTSAPAPDESGNKSDSDIEEIVVKWQATDSGIVLVESPAADKNLDL